MFVARKLILYLIVILFVGLLLKIREHSYIFFEQYNSFVGIRVNSKSNHSPLFKRAKWIVVTSINYPTEDIKKISQLEEWQLLVVADQKTPKNWSHPNVIFLGTDDQIKLNYRILKYVPWNAYTRKNIGYLYAIQHGAQYIYDTDDDNRPINLDYFNFKTVDDISIVAASKEKVFNPFGHFGQVDIWPRGYPLDAISKTVLDSAYRYTTTYSTCSGCRVPIIQQGVVNGDPDVDAIFRLTRIPEHLKPFNVQFAGESPRIAISEHTYLPYNSQNTLFHYDAFWALVLPVGVTFRVCDIWRGYWTQRLLWTLSADYYLGYVGPAAYQFRNIHNYIDDAIDETDVYFKTSKLIQHLDSWECVLDVNETPEFQKCAEKLTLFMYKGNFWTKKDVKLIEAWFADLKTIGYQIPIFDNKADTVPKAQAIQYNYYPKRLTYLTRYQINQVSGFGKRAILWIIPSDGGVNEISVVSYQESEKHYKNFEQTIFCVKNDNSNIKPFYTRNNTHFAIISPKIYGEIENDNLHRVETCVKLIKFGFIQKIHFIMSPANVNILTVDLLEKIETLIEPSFFTVITAITKKKLWLNKKCFNHNNSSTPEYLFKSSNNDISLILIMYDDIENIILRKINLNSDIWTHCLTNLIYNDAT